MRLTLINHAWCKVEADGLGLLFDPWTEGPAFNVGWDLLIPTPMGFDEIMAGVSYIWISHEHPDRFSPASLMRVAKIHGDKVTVLFQATHSSSLLFIFKHEFGFDTLTVNGRFEATADGFARMMRAFTVGSLNALGLSISWRLVFSLKLVVILARHLMGVLARLRRLEQSTSTPASAVSN